MTDTMGSALRDYKTRTTYHTLINKALDYFIVPVYAFQPEQLATIIQAKEFPDSSFYQGHINWDIMRQKTDTVILRAGQNVWIDPEFVRNYAEAKTRQMLRGIYYFYDDRVSPKAQADKLREVMGGDLPEMEIWMDWEKTYGGSYGGLKNVVACMQLIEQYYPTVTVGMYTGYYFFRDHSDAITNASQYAYLKTHPLWLAWYTSNPANVLIPKPWDSLLVWQWGTPSFGGQYGVETVEIDMNYFNGTMDDFYDRYTSGEIEPPPTGETMKNGLVIVASLNVRNAPINGEVVGGLFQGDVAHGIIDTVSGWLHVYSVTRKSGAEENLTGYCSSSPSYITITDAPEPPPVEDPEVIEKLDDILAGQVIIDNKIDSIMARLNDMDAKLDILLSDSPTIPPVSDMLDYTGAYAGTYEVIDNGESVKYINMTDSQGRQDGQMNYDTAQWMQINRPQDWAWFVSKNVIWKDTSNGLWYIKFRIYRGIGNLVKIGEINPVKNTGRIIEFSVSDNQPTTICVHSPQFVNWLFHKVQGQPYYYPLIQPWKQKDDNVPNALWVDMSLLKKV